LAQALRQSLAQDPRPHYQDDPERRYAMLFGGYEVKFFVSGKMLIIEDLSESVSKK